MRFCRPHPGSRATILSLPLALISIVKIPSSVESQVAQVGYDLLVDFNDMQNFSSYMLPENNKHFYLDPIMVPVDVLLLWTHRPLVLPESDYNESSNLVSTLTKLHQWFRNGDLSVELVGDDLLFANDTWERPRPHPPNKTMIPDCCSSNDICSPYYYCLINTLLREESDEPNVKTFHDCFTNRLNLPNDANDPLSWDCLIFLNSVSRDGNSYAQQFGTCGARSFDPNIQNWKDRNTDENLRIALSHEGGVDSDGVYWEGWRSSDILSQSIGRQFWGLNDIQCSLASPCQHEVYCDRTGSWTAISLGNARRPRTQDWVIFASTAFEHIDQQLRNQYNELKDAIESLALDTFSIDDFFPEKDQNPALQNALAGLGGVLAILEGFISFVGPVVSAAGTIASAAGTFLATSVSLADPLAPQKTFSQEVLRTYKELITGFDDAVSKLFRGESIPDTGPGSFNLTVMMSEGAWVSADVLTNVSQLNDKLRVETLARGINALWKTWPSNKMWVLFVDLQDGPDMTTNCVAHNTGPPDSKYCADGGVYYTYNFIETGDEAGGVGWPWGADKLDDVNLQLKWVTEASAKSYRVSKRARLDPFNFNQNAGTKSFLEEAFETQSAENITTLAGHFPGSWTLPVCDASTWGSSWNWDYTAPHGQYLHSPQTHPPCLCGPQALETYGWARAAGLHGFETFWHRCNDALHNGFEWPNDVTFVNYPANDGDKDYVVYRP